VNFGAKIFKTHLSDRKDGKNFVQIRICELSERVWGQSMKWNPNLIGSYLAIASTEPMINYDTAKRLKCGTKFYPNGIESICKLGSGNTDKP
jgi:hypothetical protein